MEEMLTGIYNDGFLFKEFEEHIEPLCELSHKLQRASRLADSLADMTKEESIRRRESLDDRSPQA